MPESPIHLSSIEDSLVSEDGRFVMLNAHGYDGKTTQVIIPTTALENLVRNLQILLMSADLVARTSDPVRVPTVRFNEPEPIFHVAEMGGVVRPETGLIELRIGDSHGQRFQVAMMKDQSRVLYDLLLDVWAMDDEENPS